MLCTHLMHGEQVGESGAVHAQEHVRAVDQSEGLPHGHAETRFHEIHIVPLPAHDGGRVILGSSASSDPLIRSRRQYVQPCQALTAPLLALANQDLMKPSMSASLRMARPPPGGRLANVTRGRPHPQRQRLPARIVLKPGLGRVYSKGTWRGAQLQRNRARSEVRVNTKYCVRSMVWARCIVCTLEHVLSAQCWSAYMWC